MPYTTASDCITVFILTSEQLETHRQGADALEQRWLEQQSFRARGGEFVVIPDAHGAICKVLVGRNDKDPITTLGNAAQALPAGNYRLDANDPWIQQQRYLLGLGWGLAQYQFGRYKTQAARLARLHLDEPLATVLQQQLDAHYLVRDLINTPALDMGPAELAATAAALAEEFQASFRCISGETLAAEFPAIHAVGMGSERGPRLAILEWGQPEHPLVSIAGKGVVFDTGGLNIKHGSRMLRMKKDMGGAAHALALARLIMASGLPVRIQMLLAIAENMISGCAYRPGDVIHTRRGLTIEITNTDAEGRLVLCDALQLAGEQQPDLLIDFATLTGAARIAMGPDVSPYYSNRDELQEAIRRHGDQQGDPMWPLPLVDAYERYLESDIADMVNSASTTFAGSINAALFLRRFVNPDQAWLHLDIYGWNDNSRPGRPMGGEAQGLRAVFAYLQERYAQG